MLVIGRRNNEPRREVVRFRDWIKTCTPGTYPVRAIFLPRKFQSFTFILEDDSGDVPKDVRWSMNKETALQVLKAFQFSKKRKEGTLILVVSKDEYGFELINEGAYEYREGLGWIKERQGKKKNDDFDIEF